MGKTLKKVEFARQLQFGVEIEIEGLDINKSKLAEVLNEAGIEAKAIGSVEHGNYNSWKIEHDGSLSGHSSMEIVSPVLKGVSGLRELELVLSIVNQYNPKVTANCGVHVHHYAADLEFEQIRNVYRIYAKHERAIDEIFPKSRFDNRYAKLINGSWMDSNETVIQVVERMQDIEEMKQVLGGSDYYGVYYRSQRYYKVNFVSWVNHGTLEFRQHAGSTDYQKISSWIILTHKIVETAQFAGKKIKPKGKARIAKCEPDEAYVHRNYDLYTELGLNGTEISEFIGKRNKQFRDQGVGKRGEYMVTV